MAEVTDTGPLVTYDGQAGLGHWQVEAAAETGIARASEHGVGVVAVGNSGHCGVLGIYTLPALAAGMVALVFSNGPAVMPPWGGHQPLLSTSPLAAGIPSRPEPAIVDLATSAVARGTIAQRASQGRPLDEGWAFDAAGAPTVDPKAALSGMLAPLGGAKGYALALLVEALTGGMVGPALASDVRDMYRPDQVAEPQRIAHLVITLDPDRFEQGGPPGGPSASTPWPTTSGGPGVASRGGQGPRRRPRPVGDRPTGSRPRRRATDLGPKPTAPTGPCPRRLALERPQRSSRPSPSGAMSTVTTDPSP